MNQNIKQYSIIIVNYNHGEYLEQAIISVIEQEFTDYELIIIDGGSTDNSVKIIKKYSDKIAYWVSEPDSGQSDAFNKGFGKATGEFGFWLNADDILLPNSLSVIAKQIKKHSQYSWFAGNTIFFDKNNTILRCRRGSKWNSFLSKNSPVEVYGPSSIFRISLLHKVGGFDESIHYCMDTDLWMRFVRAGEKFRRIDNYIWGFRIHEESKTSHAYSAEPSEAFAKESKRILAKNNWRYSKYKSNLKFIHKLITGSYFYSYIDTLRLRRNKINTI